MSSNHRIADRLSGGQPQHNLRLHLLHGSRSEAERSSSAAILTVDALKCTSLFGAFIAAGNHNAPPQELIFGFPFVIVSRTD